MKVFVRVVEHGAFVRAADDLGVSRATVTDAVAKLEQHLGVRLINRTTRRLSVTDEGQTHYASCVRLLDDIEEAEEALSGEGVAQVPDGLACGPVLDGRLQALLTDCVATAPPVVLVYPGNRYLTAKVRAFREFFANEFPQEGWWPQIVRHSSSRQISGLRRKINRAEMAVHQV